MRLCASAQHAAKASNGGDGERSASAPAGPTANDAGLSPATIRDLKHLRDRIQLALAHAQASKDKEKFVLPLKEYRRAVDLVLTVRRLAD
jgi:hypothetical protein